MILPLLLLGPARAACGKWIFLQLLLSGRGRCLVLAELAPAVVGGQAGSDHVMSMRSNKTLQNVAKTLSFQILF